MVGFDLSKCKDCSCRFNCVVKVPETSPVKALDREDDKEPEKYILKMIDEKHHKSLLKCSYVHKSEWHAMIRFEIILYNKIKEFLTGRSQ